MPFTTPADPNKIFEAELSAFIKVGYGSDLGPMALKVDVPEVIAGAVPGEGDLRADDIENTITNLGTSSVVVQNSQQRLLNANADSVGSRSANAISTAWQVLAVAVMLAMFSQRL